MEILAFAILMALHLAAGYFLWRSGTRLLLRPNFALGLKLGLLALSSLAVTGGTVLTEFLLILGAIQACSRFYGREHLAACEGLSPIHVIFVFTLLLPLISVVRVGTWLAKGRPVIKPKPA
jgi:hypothetical protein